MIAPTRKIHRSSASAIPDVFVSRKPASAGDPEVEEGHGERCPSSVFERSDKEEEEEEEEEAGTRRRSGRKTVKLL